MSLQATFLDTMAMETMILQFRESEYRLEGFETVSVTRQPQSLVFKFRMEVTEDKPDRVFYGVFDGHRVNQLAGRTIARKGDSLIITYTLTWDKLDDDDIADGPSPPNVGRTLKLGFSFSNAV